MDTNAESMANSTANSSIFDEKSGLCSCERENRTKGSLTKRVTNLPDLSHPTGCEALAEAKKDAEFAKIGIVIPIYNVAPYLVECLDSVLNQTYKNFYAVLVNDGSTDFLEGESTSQSLQIALEFVAKDSRFVLIDKENGGLSSARNAGINYFKSFERNAESNKNNLVILSEAKYLKKKDRDSSPTAQNDKIMGGAESALDSANQIKSLDSANIYTHKNATPNPPKIDYIIFLDSDDFWEVDLLEKCVVDIENAEVLLFDIDIFYDGLPPPIKLIT